MQNPIITLPQLSRNYIFLGTFPALLEEAVNFRHTGFLEDSLNKNAY